MRIRVLLDTAAVRGVIHKETAAVPLESLNHNRETLSIALANNAVPELVLVLHDGRISWRGWRTCIHLVDRLLDRISPVFPDDREFERISIVALA